MLTSPWGVGHLSNYTWPIYRLTRITRESLIRWICVYLVSSLTILSCPTHTTPKPGILGAHFEFVATTMEQTVWTILDIPSSITCIEDLLQWDILLIKTHRSVVQVLENIRRFVCIKMYSKSWTTSSRPASDQIPLYSHVIYSSADTLPTWPVG